MMRFSVWKHWKNWKVGEQRAPRDPNGNMGEFCLNTGKFADEERDRAIAALDGMEMNVSPQPEKMKRWLAADAQ